MEPARDDSLKRTARSKRDFLEHVETTGLKDASRPASRRNSSAPDRTEVAPDHSATEPVLTPPSVFRHIKGDGMLTQRSASDARWTLIVWILLISGIVIGAIVGTLVAANSFP